MDGTGGTGKAPKGTVDRRSGRYRVWTVPPELHEEVRRLAQQQQRTIIGQVVWMMQDALRREREQQRRREDGAAEAHECTGRPRRGVA